MSSVGGFVGASDGVADGFSMGSGDGDGVDDGLGVSVREDVVSEIDGVSSLFLLQAASCASSVRLRSSARKAARFLMCAHFFMCLVRILLTSLG